MQISRKRASKREFREWSIVLVALLLTGLFFAILHLKGVQVCYLKKYTGYPCLFCGSSRATFFLLHGKFASAFLIQPLASLALIVSTFAGMLFYFFLFLKKELLLLSFSSKEKKIYPLVLLILLLLNWAYLFSL